MRITVECGGFTRAADACLTANQTSAVLTESLTQRLAAGAGMAGDDATSSTFAQAYDGGAREAVAALADLTHAFIGAGRLLGFTADNHARAEAAAAGHPVLGYTGGSIDDDAFVRVQPASPPSSLGGQEPSLGVVDQWILDQVEGFVWPSADVDRLRAAGSAWRRAAASVAGLADHVDAAITLVEQQRSPEVPLAVDALTDLATLIGDTAWQLSHLATSCEEYADAVEAARERTRALLSEVAQMIVEGAAVSVIVTGLTGGLGGTATAAAAVARVRAQAPRFFALLTALRAGVAVAAARVERVRDELVALRARVEKFLRIPARDEVGAVWLKGGAGAGRGPGGSKPDSHGRNSATMSTSCSRESTTRSGSVTAPPWTPSVTSCARARLRARPATTSSRARRRCAGWNDGYDESRCARRQTAVSRGNWPTRSEGTSVMSSSRSRSSTGAEVPDLETLLEETSRWRAEAAVFLRVVHDARCWAWPTETAHDLGSREGIPRACLEALHVAGDRWSAAAAWTRSSGRSSTSSRIPTYVSRHELDEGQLLEVAAACLDRVEHPVLTPNPHPHPHPPARLSGCPAPRPG